MRIPRIFTEQSLTRGQRIDLDEQAALHLTRVLRLRSGARLQLFNEDGREFEADIVQISKHQAVVEIGAPLPAQPTPALRLYLAQGISKGDRMDYSLQKAVELGISGFTPLFTERTVVQLQGQRLERRMDHWRKIIISACEQSGRRHVPTIQSPLRLDDWLASMAGQFALLLHHEAEETLDKLSPPSGSVHLLIGPEGGLSPAEIQTASKHGLVAVRMGPRIMRTETAPVAALAAMQMLWGDFRQF